MNSAMIRRWDQAAALWALTTHPTEYVNIWVPEVTRPVPSGLPGSKSPELQIQRQKTEDRRQEQNVFAGILVCLGQALNHLES